MTACWSSFIAKRLHFIVANFCFLRFDSCQALIYGSASRERPLASGHRPQATSNPRISWSTARVDVEANDLCLELHAVLEKKEQGGGPLPNFEVFKSVFRPSFFLKNIHRKLLFYSHLPFLRINLTLKRMVRVILVWIKKLNSFLLHSKPKQNSCSIK